MNDANNNTTSPEKKREIELIYLDREIRQLHVKNEVSGLNAAETARMKTLLHQRDVTQAIGGSHAPQTAGTPEPENPTPLEAEGEPEPEQAGAPDVMVSPGERAGGAQVVPNAAPVEEEPTLWDLNWIVGTICGAFTNLDTSGRVLAEMAQRQALATERNATMAEARELREQLSSGSFETNQEVHDARVARTARMASLLSVPDQVAATDHADGADEGGEAASLGEDPPAPHTGLPVLDRVRHILREWTWEGKHGAVERIVFALSGGDTIWEGEEIGRLAGHAAARTEAKNDEG